MVHDAKIDTVEKVEDKAINWAFHTFNPLVIIQAQDSNATCRGAIDSTQSKTRNGTVRIHSHFLATCRHHATPSITRVTNPLREAIFA